jgi:dolichol-phosphate mannosyltransferase
VLFRLKYGDVTNAFKLYGRDAVEGMKPLVSRDFSLTVEMPLKAIVRWLLVQRCSQLVDGSD